ncbi:glycosyltransferase [Rhodopirellula sallentina]|uniref:Glycosyl transferase, group 1 n=1 Tax=Rhodopirellula sallentina SM41 TaxID=1263870 RepID=M5U630_9BACT|nr:glycosyltransferase [Rhodopirellula sallentina]EMI56910.1 glycosyl transferase, group 1 [Rhodopirellula sallentina SM41]
MNVLFLTERFPWPLDDGGNIRTFRLLEALATDYQVTMVAHHRADLPIALMQTGVADLAAIEMIRPPSRLGSWFQIVWSGVLCGRSIFVSKNYSPAMLRRAKELYSTGQFELVYFNHLDTACYLEPLDCLPAVFDSHNCLSEMANERAQDATGLAAILWRAEAKRLAAAEAAVVSHSSMTLACSVQEKQLFSKLSSSGRIEVIPNGTDAPNSVAVHRFAATGRLLFVGAMDYRPNVDAVIWFCREILPRIRAKVPEASFDIVGRSPTASVQRLAKLSNVRVVGSVEDVSSWYADADLAVIPLRMGGGTRLKAVEAMALGCPIVSTKKGIEGIEAIDEVHLRIADEPIAFANAAVGLLRNSSERRKISAAGREFAEAFNWEKLQTQFRTIVKLGILPTLRDSTRQEKT